jgi:hypothetical protein
MEDSTRLGLGISRFVLLGVTILGTLAACAAVTSRAADLFKPIAQLYQINPNGTPAALTGGGTAAPAAPAASGGPAAPAAPTFAQALGVDTDTAAPAADPNALPKLLDRLSRTGNRDVKRTLADLQRQLGQAAPPVSAEAPATSDTTSAELAELKRQLAECRDQLRVLTTAQQQQQTAAAAAQASAAAPAVAAPAAVVAEPDPRAELERQENEYADAVNERREAEAAFERLKADPKTSNEQVYAAAYELMAKRSAVTRLESDRARAHRMAVATVAD